MPATSFFRWSARRSASATTVRVGLEQPEGREHRAARDVEVAEPVHSAVCIDDATWGVGVHPCRAEVVEVALEQHRWTFVAQHELDVAARSAASTTFCGRPDRGSVRLGWPPVESGDGQAERVPPVPSVIRESELGACSADRRRSSDDVAEGGRTSLPALAAYGSP